MHGPWTLAVSQTVSQNRAFDLFTDSAKILIRLKVRTEVVPQQGIELRPRAPFPQFQVPRTVVQVYEFLKLTFEELKGL